MWSELERGKVVVRDQEYEPFEGYLKRRGNWKQIKFGDRRSARARVELLGDEMGGRKEEVLCDMKHGGLYTKKRPKLFIWNVIEGEFLISKSGNQGHMVTSPADTQFTCFKLQHVSLSSSPPKAWSQ